jgi:uncharacterized protein (DUF1810 family)
MGDPFNLQRFVDAQDGVLDDVRAELSAGRKRTHWMWFVFPQIAGLGQSEMARRYAIQSLAEARAYLDHPVLGVRIAELTRMLNDLPPMRADAVFGYPDDMKFHSSMTLFAQAAPDSHVFGDALHRYFDGQQDEATLARLH